MEAAEDKPEFEDLLRMLKENRGFDFSGYKRPTMVRRVLKRMGACELQTFGEYSDYLELEPEEFTRLFDSLLINVTGFFRDPPAWDALCSEVLPGLLTAKGPNRPIRVWSAGCATGQEAYTLAIVLAEALGPEDFRNRVKIYATDLDENALREARAGTYTERQLLGVPSELREIYFEPYGTGYVFRRDLRRQVIFGRNDLTRDAPISRVDLLVARNTLMYFNAETQANVVRRFHFALTNPGYLFLGKAEMILNHSDLFEPVDLRKRLFRKIVPESVAGEPRDAREGLKSGDRLGSVLAAATLSAGPVAQLAVDLGGKLAVANSRAEALFNLHPRDVGRPFHDLEVSYRPAELRSIIDRATVEHRQIDMRDVVWQRPAASEADVYDVSVVPLHAAGELVGIGISFTDVTHYRRLRDQLEQSNQELERAYEELQSLNEELETTNEELQSTNEELETTNEELQSTNEELETMNEELQSTNDELQEINDALRQRSGELDATNEFLASVLRSLGSAVIVVDRELKIQVWSPGAQDLWGMRADEAEGRPVLTLDIGLPLGEIGQTLLRIMKDEVQGTTSAVQAVNRRGRPVRLQIDYRMLHGQDHSHAGVIMIMNPSEEEES